MCIYVLLNWVGAGLLVHMYAVRSVWILVVTRLDFYFVSQVTAPLRFRNNAYGIIVFSGCPSFEHERMHGG